MGIVAQMAASRKRQLVGGDMNTYAKWNVADAFAGYTVSLDGYTTSKPSGNDNKSIRSFMPKKTGKWYVEMSLTGTTPDGIIALCTSNMSVESYPGSTPESVFFAEQTMYVSGFDVLDTFGYGNVQQPNSPPNGFAIDLDAKRAWFRFNNGTWFGGGDPETGTSPRVGWDNVNLPLYLATRLYYADATLTLNSGYAPFTHSPPAGFKLGWYSTPNDLVNLLDGLPSTNFTAVGSPYSFTASRVNDGIGLVVSNPAGSNCMLTTNQNAATNNGVGIQCVLAAPTAVKEFQISSYRANDSAECDFKIEAFVTGAWQEVALVPNTGAGAATIYNYIVSDRFNENGAVVSDTWRFTIANWNVANTNNFYVGEIRLMG